MQIESLIKSFTKDLLTFGDYLLLPLFEINNDFSANVADFIIEVYSKFCLYAIQYDIANASKVQQELLKKILDFQQNTEYGRRYNFASIKSADEFRHIHPLTTYENYRNLIDQITIDGNYSRLVAEPIILFQETSGTTGASKLIPRTGRSVSILQKVFSASVAVCENNFRHRATRKRGLAFHNIQPVKTTPSGIPKAPGSSDSRFLKFKSIQKLYALFFVNPAPALFIKNYRSASYCHLLFGLRDLEVSYLTANFASSIFEALQLLESEWEQLVSDIETGTVSSSLEIEEPVRNDLQSLLKPDPQRANQLRTEFRKGFDNILPRVWTQLSYIQCVTTGTMQIYKEKLKNYTGEIPFYSGNFGASEAWIGLNLEPQGEATAYTVTPHSAFFEFIPASDVDSETPKTIDLSSLVIGESYETVVTTIAGLYRYRLGDVVKCVGYSGQSPLVEFLYRLGTLLNISGEKVSEQEVFIAFMKATTLLGKEYEIKDYTTCIDLSAFPSRYLLYVEMAQSTQESLNLPLFVKEIEKSVFDLNILYSRFRKTGVIGLPILKVVRENSFKRLKEKIISQHSSDSQFKMPRLLKDLDLINFIEHEVISTS